MWKRNPSGLLQDKQAGDSQGEHRSSRIRFQEKRQKKERTILQGKTKTFGQPYKTVSPQNFQTNCSECNKRKVTDSGRRPERYP